MHHRHPRFNSNIPFVLSRYRMDHVAWILDRTNGFQELQTLVRFTEDQQVKNWDITQAVAISDSGWIAANAVTVEDGVTIPHGVLLRPPAPPPSSWLLMLR